VKRAASLLLFLACWLGATAAHAHAFTPFVLELRERDGGTFDAELRRPLGQEPPAVELPANCTLLSDAPDRTISRCPELRGAKVVARAMGPNELLVRVHFLDGATTSAALRHDGDAFVVPLAPPPTSAGIATFVALGVHHIFAGLDHLAFLVVLVLLVHARAARRGVGPIAAALTAFTVAHSITLALAAFDVLRLAPSLAEPLIALSVVMLAAELARGPRARSVLARRPAVAAFAFGLLHGTGFATGLGAAGVPRAELPLALLGFNVGVELGQLAFVAVTLTLLALARRVPVASLVTRPRLVGYATGALAAGWTIERLGEVLR
jgi:hypothetical protein